MYTSLYQCLVKGQFTPKSEYIVFLLLGVLFINLDCFGALFLPSFGDISHRDVCLFSIELVGPRLCGAQRVPEKIFEKRIIACTVHFTCHMMDDINQSIYCYCSMVGSYLERSCSVRVKLNNLYIPYYLTPLSFTTVICAPHSILNSRILSICLFLCFLPRLTPSSLSWVWTMPM